MHIITRCPPSTILYSVKAGYQAPGKHKMTKSNYMHPVAMIRSLQRPQYANNGGKYLCLYTRNTCKVSSLSHTKQRSAKKRTTRVWKATTVHMFGEAKLNFP